MFSLCQGKKNYSEKENIPLVREGLKSVLRSKAFFIQFHQEPQTIELKPCSFSQLISIFFNVASIILPSEDHQLYLADIKPPQSPCRKRDKLPEESSRFLVHCCFVESFLSSLFISKMLAMENGVKY